MRRKNYFELVFIVLVLSGFLVSKAYSITSKIVRHSSETDFSDGQSEDVVIDSKGTIQLANAAEILAENLEDVWSINCVAVNSENAYIGTSPNGGIYRYHLGEIEKVYPQQSDDSKPANDSNDPNLIERQQYLSNEHIFALTFDFMGRALAGVSGKECKLIRFEKGEVKTIFEPKGAKYIFALTLSADGDVYMATGPNGNIYKLDSFGDNPEIIYTSKDKNILSLAIGPDGFVYAGSDERGLVYKINPETKTATVLYDSDQPEITALLFNDKGDLYAAATSAEIVEDQKKYITQQPFAGRPEKDAKEKAGEAEDGMKLKVANTKKESNDEKEEPAKPAANPTGPEQPSFIYKISEDGFVTEVFGESAVFFSMTEMAGKLFLGTGNHAELFEVEPNSERQKIVYKDKQASQITAVTSHGDDVYIGTANPAKLIKLADGFAADGSFVSSLIDGGQPARWGKLQIEADVPKECKVLMSARSGNVKDANDPTFSRWTKPIDVTGPVQLDCPVGRFCQYKLMLETQNAKKSPVVREVAVANTISNLSPKVEAVDAERQQDKKEGIFKINYKASDRNDDKLVYKIDFRKIGRENWIELKDKAEEAGYEWDSRTVEDGRYEVRVTASDELSNTDKTKLAGSRVSEPIIVDNTAPVIVDSDIMVDAKRVVIDFEVEDELSVIGQTVYTVDSNVDWINVVPNDFVFDTVKEKFTIVVEDLSSGEHIVSIRISDDVGNAAYKTFEINVAGK